CRILHFGGGWSGHHPFRFAHARFDGRRYYRHHFHRPRRPRHQPAPRLLFPPRLPLAGGAHGMTAQRTDLLDLTADVLVIGGGPAGCWAALSALEAGASVVLVEKGYTGTSGPTAAGNSSIVDTPPGSEQRRKAVAQRADRGLGLVDEALVDRVYDQTHTGLNRLLDWGYRFPRNDEGQLYRGSMRGVDYLRFMRQRLIKKGAVLLDQSPALKLLVHDH